MFHFFNKTSTKKDGNLSFLYSGKAQVIQNRQKFLQKYHLKLDDCITLRTQHSTKIRIVDYSSKGKEAMDIESAIPVDALITQDKNLILFLLTADCLPLTFYDPQEKVVCLAHLSQKNTKLKFVEKIVEALVNKFNSRPENILVFIGPGIHKESYFFDLIETNTQQLTSKGIINKNISISPIDTFANLNFFSHRRSQTIGESEGRFATILSLSVLSHS